MFSSQFISHVQMLDLIETCDRFLADLKAKIETQIAENSINCISIQDFINNGFSWQSGDRLWLTWDIVKSDFEYSTDKATFQSKLNSIKKEINSHPLGKSFDLELISFRCCQSSTKEILEICLQVDIYNHYQAKKLILLLQN